MDPGIKPSLIGQSFLVQCMSTGTHIGNLEALCVHFVVPLTFQETSYRRINASCVLDT
jgi:hypothetical protein